MRRVSSRQRLVSWDAFDATAPEEDSNFSDSDEVGIPLDDDDDDVVGYDSALEDNSRHDITLTLSPPATSPAAQDSILVGRKRDRSSRCSENKVISTVSPVTGVSSPNLVRGPAVTSPLAVPALIPIYAWEHGTDDCQNLTYSTSTNTLSSFVTTSSTLLPSPTSTPISPITPLHLNDLMKDAHVAIFAFLDLNSLQSVMAVNTLYRRLVLSKDARTSLWDHHCIQKWRVDRNKKQFHASKTSFPSYVDRFHLPTAVAAPQTTNLPLLLNMTPDLCPTGVDEDLLEAQNARMERLGPLLRVDDDHPIRALRRPTTTQTTGNLKSYQDSTGRSLVQYTGSTGAGDRCIRSDHPLPRPNPHEQQHDDAPQQSPLSKSRFLVSLLRRGANKVVSNRSSSNASQQSQPTWKPFVVPFKENSTTVNVTPRLISYYEVSILDLENNESSDNGDDDSVSPVPPPARPAGHRSDCVAVGLATQSFHVHTRMPGWDRQSFGYHGDDGGIFHSSGTMVKQFGSKFGAGDTVGCGIDYVTKGIFFTLNGSFMGYGWTGIDEELLQNDLYPVVGLDTNCPLSLNFGADEPFQFDLAQFIMKHETIIASQYSFDTTPTTVETVIGGQMTREPSLLSFPSSSSLVSLTSTASSTTGRRRFRRRGMVAAVRERSRGNGIRAF
ncbi:SPRY domain containing protein [Nitzschia inconspicua]|uniref:SPRY domain containing protein n=1 Tax=Nitzschia inconspicua TaxID=303405 RepID=A0A9K3KYI6_9STRA|nr:SPRY domain containing protein [Nitzschia inconspicua]